MKKLFYLLGTAVMVSLIFIACQKNVNQVDPQAEASLKAQSECTTIQSGELVNSAGETIETGYDDFGYNYQAHMYNGDYYGNGDNLVMKWNDAWLANKDCDGDGLLDRHFGFDSYIGSGAWETNHWTGTYVDADGNECHWTYFIKIIAVPADATINGGIWYNADGTEIGPDIWGQFAIIQEVSNDPCAGDHGLLYLSPDHAGFGGW